MASHKRLGASSRHRWARCPGSVRECAKYPSSTNEFAIDGTHSHTLLEHCVKGDLLDPFDFVDKTLVDEYGSFTVDIERAGRVKIAIDYINMRKEELGDCIIKSEFQPNLQLIFGRDDIGGTMDVMLMNSKVIEIIDYKDGMTPVSAENNKQLELYAWGAIAECIRLQPTFQGVETIRMTIIQPKLMVKGLPAISFVDVPYDVFVNSMNAITEEALATDDPNAPLIAGDHCTYCSHSGSCRSLAEKSVSSVGIDFYGEDFAMQLAKYDPLDFNDDRLVEVIESASMIRKFLEAVEEEALKRLNLGKAIPGLKLVKGRGSKKWAFSETEIEEKLTKMLKVPKSAIYKQELVSPAQANNITWVAKGETKKLSPKQLAILEDELIVVVGGKPALALDSDYRQAINNDVSGMFAAVEPVTQQIPTWLTVNN